MLTVDACVSPAGDLVVACHSGGPDWGSGPTGSGKLYKINYADRDHPQPVFAWPSGPRELRVEFDRPVDPKLLRDVLAESKLTGGQVRAGRRSVRIALAGLCGGSRAEAVAATMMFRCGRPNSRRTVARWSWRPIRCRVPCTTRCSFRAWAAVPPATSQMSVLPQHAAIDLDFDLSGCEATWRPADGSRSMDRLAAASRSRCEPAFDGRQCAARRTCGPP